MEKVIGKVKSGRYGERIVGVIKEYIGSEAQDASQVKRRLGGKRPREQDVQVIAGSSEDECMAN